MRILIAGGYGVFGLRAAERLARVPGFDVVIAGRDAAKAEAAAAKLGRDASARVSAQGLDIATAGANDLERLGVNTVVHAAGPFHVRDYRFQQAAMAAGCHLIDLADARAYVTGITALDRDAKAAGVLVVSGASSVPGLSSAVVTSLAPRFSRLDAISIGISPANSFDPGEATVASVLAGVGRPMTIREGGRERRVFGWQGIRRERIQGVGTRWMGHVDGPDLALLPAAYPQLEAVHFQAGAEVALSHFGMWGMSWLVRSGLVRHPERWAGPLLAMKRRLSCLGSDRGGMFVALSGLGGAGQPLTLRWSLAARQGHGPYVPVTPAVIIAKRLAEGRETRTGALPCMGLFTPEDFMAEVADLDIAATLTEERGRA